jgi:glycerate 2-kinase
MPAVAAVSRAAGAVADSVLVAARAFDRPRLAAHGVAGALARGLRAGGREHLDLCPLPDEGELVSLLAALGFEARMRASRAVVVAEPRLLEPALTGSMAFELATRARQAGVPAYAVTAENRLDSFDARMLDLQAILLASSTRSLAAVGRRLARLL